MLSLYQRYYDAVSCEFPEFFEEIIEADINLNEALEAKDYQKISRCHAELTKMLEEEKLSGMLLQFDIDIKNPESPRPTMEK